jgi:hypothetical protein
MIAINRMFVKAGYGIWLSAGDNGVCKNAIVDHVDQLRAGFAGETMAARRRSQRTPPVSDTAVSGSGMSRIGWQKPRSANL